MNYSSDVFAVSLHGFKGREGGTKGRQLAHSLKVRALGRARGAHASTSVAPLTYG